jgi:RimJ/RimL family protein N-acetyltransferase
MKKFTDIGFKMSLKRFIGKVLNFVFTTNSAIWFEKDLTEKLVDIQPKIPIEIDMNSTSQTIEWLKSQNESWVTNPKEIAAALKYNHCWLSVRTNGNIIGCIKIGFRNPYITDYKRVIELPERMGFMYDSFIIPEQRGKGVVTYVAMQVLKFLKAQGYTRAGLHVPSWNKASLRAVEKMGFKKVIYIKCFRIFDYPILIGKSTPESSTFKEGKILKYNTIYERIKKTS